MRYHGNICVCCHPIYSSWRQVDWTHHPGSHRKEKVTWSTRVFFFLYLFSEMVALLFLSQEGVSHPTPSSTALIHWQPFDVGHGTV